MNNLSLIHTHILDNIWKIEAAFKTSPYGENYCTLLALLSLGHPQEHTEESALVLESSPPLPLSPAAGTEASPLFTWGHCEER